jgi:ABC-2 type transport system ATP-binding protein
MSDILSIEHLDKSFGTTAVLRDFNMALERGKVHGLLGRNGAGKTTLIRIIMGIIPRDRGTLSFQGRAVSYRDAAFKNDIGYVPEDPFFYDDMTIRDLLMLNAGFYARWDQRQADELLERFALRPKMRIGTCSRGMKLKLGLAVAWAAHPELLVLDDPTSGLDVPTRRDFLKDLIRTLAEAGTTILFSTHLVHELERIVESIHILHGGRLALSGDSVDAKRERGAADLEELFLSVVA